MKVAALVAATVLSIGLSSTAGAYELEKTLAGIPLHRGGGVVPIELAFTPVPSGVSLAKAQSAAILAATAWTNELPDMSVSIQAVPAGRGSPHAQTAGINQVRWAMNRGDPDIEDGILGRAFVSYRVADGVIVDSDIVLNAVDFQWTIVSDGCRDVYDVESALAHEFGHTLGLAHSVGHSDATMFATVEECELTKRDLSEDDRSGIVELYRTSKADLSTCSDASDCSEDGGCAVGGNSNGLAACLLALTMFAMRHRRRVNVGALAVLIAAVSGPAEAGTFRYLSLDALGSRAVSVVSGRVLATAMATDQPFAIDTTIRVEGCFGGQCSSTVTVRSRGGEQDGMGLRVEGEPQLTVGASVVVYLRRDTEGHLRVMGGVQGAFRMVGIAGVGLMVRDMREHLVVVPKEGRDKAALGAVEIFNLADVWRTARGSQLVAPTTITPHAGSRR